MQRYSSRRHIYALGGAIASAANVDKDAALHLAKYALMNGDPATPVHAVLEGMRDVFGSPEDEEPVDLVHLGGGFNISDLLAKVDSYADKIEKFARSPTAKLLAKVGTAALEAAHNSAKGGADSSGEEEAEASPSTLQELIESPDTPKAGGRPPSAPKSAARARGGSFLGDIFPPAKLFGLGGKKPSASGGSLLDDIFPPAKLLGLGPKKRGGASVATDAEARKLLHALSL